MDGLYALQMRSSLLDAVRKNQSTLLPEKSVKLLTVFKWPSLPILDYLAFLKKKAKTKIEGAQGTLRCASYLLSCSLMLQVVNVMGQGHL